MILSCFFASGSLDIAVYDTYYVIASWQIFTAIAILFFLFGGIVLSFRFFKRPLNRALLLIHFVITSLSALAIVVSILEIILVAKERTFKDYSVYEDMDSSIDFQTTAVLIGAFAQLLFLINVLWTLLKRKEKSKE